MMYWRNSWSEASLVAIGMILGFWMTVAHAQSLKDAEMLLEQGDFIGGAESAAALGTSEGLTMAAEALAFYGYYLAPEGEKQALFKRGWGYAEEAISLDPESSEAYLQLSHTMGRYAQTIGVLVALNEGFADRIKDAIDKSIERDPENSGAYVSLAAWHAEIVASAGFMAGILYGANEEDSRAAYAKALALAPEDATVRLEYGIGLLTLDDSETDAAKDAFRQAIALAPTYAAGQVVRGEAERRLAELGD